MELDKKRFSIRRHITLVLTLLTALIVPLPLRVTVMVLLFVVVSSVMLVGEMDRLPAAFPMLQLTLFGVVLPSLQR